MNNPVIDRMLVYIVLALALLATGAVLAGDPPPLTETQFGQLGESLMDIEWMRKPGALEQHERVLKARLAAAKEAAEQGRLSFLLGYAAEFRETIAPKNPRRPNYAAAKQYYTRAGKSGSGYAWQAHYRLGVLGALGLLGSRAASLKSAEASFRKIAEQQHQRLWVRQHMPSKAPAALTLVELAGAKSPDGGNRALLITSPAAAIKEGPVLQPFSMSATARARLQTLANGGQNQRK
jgi:hypothetical protein